MLVDVSHKEGEFIPNPRTIKQRLMNREFFYNMNKGHEDDLFEKKTLEWKGKLLNGETSSDDESEYKETIGDRSRSPSGWAQCFNVSPMLSVTSETLRRCPSSMRKVKPQFTEENESQFTEKEFQSAKKGSQSVEKGSQSAEKGSQSAEESQSNKEIESQSTEEKVSHSFSQLSQYSQSAKAKESQSTEEKVSHSAEKESKSAEEKESHHSE